MKPLIVVPGAVSQKCVMRKRQDVNVLRRKKKKHTHTIPRPDELGTGGLTKQNKTGFFLREVSEHDYRALRMSVRALRLAAFPELVWPRGRTPGGASV